MDGRSLQSAAELNKRLSNWLLKNWWIIPALIVVFGALAWADPTPSSVPVNPAGGTSTISPTVSLQTCVDRCAKNSPCGCSQKCKSVCGGKTIDCAIDTSYCPVPKSAKNETTGVPGLLRNLLGGPGVIGGEGN